MRIGVTNWETDQSYIETRFTTPPRREGLLSAPRQDGPPGPLVGACLHSSHFGTGSLCARWGI